MHVEKYGKIKPRLTCVIEDETEVSGGESRGRRVMQKGKEIFNE